MSGTLKYPLSTEKSVRLLSSENKIVFVVENKSNKKQIKEDFEKMFKVKVLKVNTLIHKGRKKAYIKLPPENPAIDIATQMGLM
ncbi:MAG: 50S ribosomal protein L23 [Candidatus Woesearchaeota archaeon]